MNNTIFFFFYNLAHQSKIFDNIVVFTAVYFPFVVVMLAGLFLLFHHEVLRAESPARVFWEKKKEMFFIFLPAIIAGAISIILKVLVYVPRPFVLFPQVQSLFPEIGSAFPSFHATVFSALAFSLFFLHKKVGYVFMFFALLIGLARIIAGVHFPIDILGGFVLGGTVSYLVAYFIKNR